MKNDRLIMVIVAMQISLLTSVPDLILKNLAYINKYNYKW